MLLRTPLVTAAVLPLCLVAPGAAQENDGEVPDEIIVEGRAQKLYRVGESDTGKLPASPLETPIVITTINEQLIEDQGARDAQDIYRNISGVSLFSYAGVTARGFRQEEIFFDGLRGDPYVGFNVPQLFNVSRVDFLKGPAAVLYGPGAPGGLFNYVTKKPEEDFYAEGRLIYGSEGRRGASFEINGALPVEGSAGRLGVFHEDRNLPRDNADSVVTIYDGGVSQELGFAKLTLQATRYEQDQAANRLRGVPVDDEGEFLTDRRWNHNEPDDFLDLWSNNVQARLEGEVGQEFTWNAAVRYTDSEQTQGYHEPRGLFLLQPLSAAAPGTPGAVYLTGDGAETLDPTQAETIMVREFRDQLREQEQLSFGANGIWSRDFGGLSNRLLFGIEHYEDELFLVFDRVRGNNRFTPGLPQPLSLLDPVYGQSDPADYDPAAFTNFPDRLFNQTRQGAYVIEELTFGKLIVTGGIRFDRFEDSLDYENDIAPREEFDDEAVTFRAGGVYRFTDEISAFAQWAEGFEPQGTGSQDARFGGPFDPQESESYEGGIKTALFGGRLNTTLAIYDITRTNILQADPRPEADADDLVAVGEVTSTGFEIDLVADITPDWVLTAAYGYNDTRVTGDNGSTSGIRNSVGDRFANAPEHQFGFWTRYQVPAIDTAFAFGGDYVSDRISLSGQPVNSYFVADASIIYSPGPFEVLIRGDNLFDEEYAESGFIERTGHFPGAPRSVFVELIKRW